MTFARGLGVVLSFILAGCAGETAGDEGPPLTKADQTASCAPEVLEVLSSCVEISQQNDPDLSRDNAIAMCFEQDLGERFHALCEDYDSFDCRDDFDAFAAQLPTCRSELESACAPEVLEVLSSCVEISQQNDPDLSRDNAISACIEDTNGTFHALCEDYDSFDCRDDFDVFVAQLSRCRSEL